MVRTRLALPEGGKVGIFIKRQENHVYWAWQNLFRPAATFEREFLNLLRFRRLGITTLETAYFGQRMVGGKLPRDSRHARADGVPAGRCRTLPSGCAAGT